MASSNCEVYGGFNNFTSNSSGSSTQMVAAFRWKGKYSEGNSFASKDIFAVTWSSPFIERSSRGYLSYVNTHYGDTVDTTATVNADDLYLSSIQVIKNESTVVNGDVRGHWIDAGSIISELSTKTKTPDIVAYAAYGLNTAYASPSVSVGKDSAGVGLSFGSKIKNVGSARFYN
ncbi:hypothetical protein [Sporanaerobacter sp.]|uniref:hypothetical protein n=1 Tax=Sporanaerobacter sp. TaxID=2010183 RepID=UPI003A0FD1A1